MRTLNKDVAQINLAKLQVQKSKLESRYEALKVEMEVVNRKLLAKDDTIRLLQAKLDIALDVVSGGQAA